MCTHICTHIFIYAYVHIYVYIHYRSVPVTPLIFPPTSTPNEIWKLTPYAKVKRLKTKKNDTSCVDESNTAYDNEATASLAYLKNPEESRPRRGQGESTRNGHSKCE